MSQAEPSAPPEPDPQGGARTTTATADAPTTDAVPKAVADRPRIAAAPSAVDGRVDDGGPPARGAGGDGSGRGADADVHRRFWGEDEPAGRSSRRGGRRRRRARRQLWVVRNVSTWSVLKVSVLFFACMWAVLLVAGTVLWQVASRYGLIGNLESFWAEATGSEEVRWDGEVVFRSAALATGVLAVASVAFATVLSVLFNLICDMTGGIRFTVLQVEPRRASDRRPRSRR